MFSSEMCVRYKAHQQWKIEKKKNRCQNNGIVSRDKDGGDITLAGITTTPGETYAIFFHTPLLFWVNSFIAFCCLLISVDIVLDFNAGTRARDQVEEQSDQKVQYLIYYLYRPIISVMQLPFNLRQNIADPVSTNKIYVQ